MHYLFAVKRFAARHDRDGDRFAFIDASKAHGSASSQVKVYRDIENLRKRQSFIDTLESVYAKPGRAETRVESRRCIWMSRVDCHRDRVDLAGHRYGQECPYLRSDASKPQSADDEGPSHGAESQHAIRPGLDAARSRNATKGHAGNASW